MFVFNKYFSAANKTDTAALRTLGAMSYRFMALSPLQKVACEAESHHSSCVYMGLSREALSMTGMSFVKMMECKSE